MRSSHSVATVRGRPSPSGQRDFRSGCRLRFAINPEATSRLAGPQATVHRPTRSASPPHPLDLPQVQSSNTRNNNSVTCFENAIPKWLTPPMGSRRAPSRAEDSRCGMTWLSCTL